MSLIDAMKWRYATKRMNGKKVEKAKLDNILEAIRLSASSAGIQPYNVIVVDNDELKKKIQPIAFNQPQITEASHLLIFAAWDDVTPERFDDIEKDLADQRGITLDEARQKMERYRGMVVGRDGAVNHQWAARQTYIAFGTAIAAAAMEHVDATPMEGFNPSQLDELLGLKEKGLRSLSILTLGYRDEENDWLVRENKVRRPKEKLFIEIGEPVSELA
jgi:nitroreductase/dihydropteridine reductase